MDISSALFIVVTSLLILILLAFLVLLIFIIKTVKDVRDMASHVKELSAELKDTPLLELLNEPRFKKNVLAEIKKSAVKLLPVISSILAFLAFRKKKNGKKKK